MVLLLMVVIPINLYATENILSNGEYDKNIKWYEDPDLSPYEIEVAGDIVKIKHYEVQGATYAYLYDKGNERMDMTIYAKRGSYSSYRNHGFSLRRTGDFQPGYSLATVGGIGEVIREVGEGITRSGTESYYMNTNFDNGGGSYNVDRGGVLIRGGEIGTKLKAQIYMNFAPDIVVMENGDTHIRVGSKKNVSGDIYYGSAPRIVRVEYKKVGDSRWTSVKTNTEVGSYRQSVPIDIDSNGEYQIRAKDSQGYWTPLSGKVEIVGAVPDKPTVSQPIKTFTNKSIKLNVEYAFGTEIKHYRKKGTSTWSVYTDSVLFDSNGVYQFMGVNIHGSSSIAEYNINNIDKIKPDINVSWKNNK